MRSNLLKPCRPLTKYSPTGPKENTTDDFWRMVWEQHVTQIVMVTKLVTKPKKTVSNRYISASNCGGCQKTKYFHPNIAKDRLMKNKTNVVLFVCFATFFCKSSECIYFLCIFLFLCLFVFSFSRKKKCFGEVVVS